MINFRDTLVRFVPRLTRLALGTLLVTGCSGDGDGDIGSHASSSGDATTMGVTTATTMTPTATGAGTNTSGATTDTTDTMAEGSTTAAATDTTDAEGSSSGGDSSTGGVPDGWTCADHHLGDGLCSCGCGGSDPECNGSTDPADCDECQTCSSFLSCEVSVDPTDLAQCVSGAVCGNGILEPTEACDGLDGLPAGFGCETFGYTGGALVCRADCLNFDLFECTGIRPVDGWTCPPVYYGAGDGCDCGCGIVDPDCADETLESCLYCKDIGGCASVVGENECPANIDPSNNAVCL